VHTHFSQATVVTGRLASSDPNLQNIPVRSEEGRRIRTAFIAPPGSSIVSADYSQIELRIMAHLSGDARYCSKPSPRARMCTAPRPAKSSA
jgi:DNA polymerase-1